LAEDEGEAPNPNIQAPGNLQHPKSQKGHAGAFEYGSLKLLWMLELDIWSFSARSPSRSFFRPTAQVKHQIPTSKLQRIFNIQIPKRHGGRYLDIGV
jgi:hypothetical protein